MPGCARSRLEREVLSNARGGCQVPANTRRLPADQRLGRKNLAPRLLIAAACSSPTTHRGCATMSTDIDARRNAGRPSDRGIAATLEHPLGCRGKYVPFLRYAYADRELNSIRQNMSVGLGIEDFFGQNDDVVGVAASWQSPANTILPDQYAIETFYRFYLTPRTHVSPDIQVVIDPANAPTKGAVTLFGLRLRTLY